MIYGAPYVAALERVRRAAVQVAGHAESTIYMGRSEVPTDDVLELQSALIAARYFPDLAPAQRDGRITPNETGGSVEA